MHSDCVCVCSCVYACGCRSLSIHTRIKHVNGWRACGWYMVYTTRTENRWMKKCVKRMEYVLVGGTDNLMLFCLYISPLFFTQQTTQRKWVPKFMWERMYYRCVWILVVLFSSTFFLYKRIKGNKWCVWFPFEIENIFNKMKLQNETHTMVKINKNQWALHIIVPFLLTFTPETSMGFSHSLTLDSNFIKIHFKFENDQNHFA